jgi:tRNA-dihydrouridine synthase
MVGRGALGQPWRAAAIEAELAGLPAAEPDAEERLAIVLDHLSTSLRFHGDHLGLRTFRKHLAAYIDAAPCNTEDGREARRRLCRLETMGEIATALGALWGSPPARMAA